MSNADLKLSARKSLKGNYGLLIFVVIIFALLGGVCNVISNLINAKWTESLFMLIIESLIGMGAVSMVIKVSRGKKIQLNDLMSQTDLLFKYMGITILLSLIGLLMYVLEYLSFKSLVMVMNYFSEINTILAILLIVFGGLLCVFIILLTLYLIISFSQVYFVLYDNPKMPILKVLGRSFDMMEDYILEYFILILSFIGWIVLGIFTLGLLYLWLIPYISVTCAKFYNVIKKEYDETSSENDELFRGLPKEDEVEKLF